MYFFAIIFITFERCSVKRNRILLSFGSKVNLSVGIIASLASKILAAACDCGQR
jgi:hypothetical protein